MLGQHGRVKMCQGVLPSRVTVGGRQGGGCPDVSRSGRLQMCRGGVTLDFTRSAPTSTQGSVCPLVQSSPACCTRASGHCPFVLLWGLSPRACSPLGSMEIACVKRVQVNVSRRQRDPGTGVCKQPHMEHISAVRERGCSGECQGSVHGHLG